MTQLSEVYGQIVDERELLNERTIASYRGGTERPVVQEIIGALAGAAAKGAASALGGKAVNAVIGNEDQESEGQGGPAQEFVVGSIVDIDESQGGGSGEIVDTSGTKPGFFWVETEDGDSMQIHPDYLIISPQEQSVNTEDETVKTWDAGHTELYKGENT